MATELPSVEPLSAGDPLNAYFPAKTRISDRPNGIEVYDPRRAGSLFYEKAACYDDSPIDGKDGGSMQRSVQDVIILGEVSARHALLPSLHSDIRILQGHSAWGQFNLVGRIRPCDGFICLSKEYVSLAAVSPYELILY